MISSVLRLIGRNLFHVRYINLSYRMRGRVHRIHTNNIAMMDVLMINEKSIMLWYGGLPVNRIAVSNLISRMFVYSAMKIRANILLLYSVLNPDTSSDSPSAKSNGVRLVSARFVVNQIIIIGINISITHDLEFIDIIDMSIDWVAIRATSKISAIDTSYEIVCAILRSAPSRAYFELEHQPEMNVE